MGATTGWGRAGWGEGPWGNGLAIDGVETTPTLTNVMVTGAATGLLLSGVSAEAALGTAIVALDAQATLTGVSTVLTVDNVLVWGATPVDPPVGNWSPVNAGPAGGWAPVGSGNNGGWTPVVT